MVRKSKGCTTSSLRQGKKGSVSKAMPEYRSTSRPRRGPSRDIECIVKRGLHAEYEISGTC